MRLRSFISLPSKPLSRLLPLAALMYLALLARPGFLFANVVTVGPLTVYSHAASPGLRLDVQRAATRLAAAPLPSSSATHRIYLTHSATEFTLLAPSSAHAFGVTYPLLQTSFLAPSNPAADLIRANRNDFNQRSLSSVIAHEATHSILEDHFGVAHLLVVPAWKKEGYCEYVARGSSFGDEKAGLKLLATHPPDSPASRYFQAYLRVRYLLETQRLTVDQLFASTTGASEADQALARSISEAAQP